MTETSDVFYITADLIIAALVIALAVMFSGAAREAQTERAAEAANMEALSEYRQWERHFGEITGADLIDFVTRHKYDCDIVIRNTVWGTELLPLLDDDALVLGLAGHRNMPDYVWDADFLYSEVLKNKGTRHYTARPLYDGNLTSGTGLLITGIEYTEV